MNEWKICILKKSTNHFQFYWLLIFFHFRFFLLLLYDVINFNLFLHCIYKYAIALYVNILFSIDHICNAFINASQTFNITAHIVQRKSSSTFYAYLSFLRFNLNCSSSRLFNYFWIFFLYSEIYLNLNLFFWTTRYPQECKRQLENTSLLFNYCLFRINTTDKNSQQHNNIGKCALCETAI